MIKSMNIKSPQFNLCTGKELSKLNYQSPKDHIATRKQTHPQQVFKKYLALETQS